ncbi:MAG: GNAT family protein [Thermoplasmataceae archaeon]
MKALKLVGETVTLSNVLNDNYAEELAEAANDPIIPELIGGHNFPHPYLKEDAINFFHMNREDGKQAFAMDFIIFYGEKIAGVIGLKDIDYEDHKAHVGYWVGKTFRSMGVATEALGLICNFCRETLSIRRLHTGVLENNVASMKVLLKNGFSIEGYEKDSMYLNGRYVSMFRFARILP